MYFNSCPLPLVLPQHLAPPFLLPHIRYLHALVRSTLNLLFPMLNNQPLLITPNAPAPDRPGGLSLNSLQYVKVNFVLRSPARDNSSDYSYRD